jgi:iron complex outermembrane receptor protein
MKKCFFIFFSFFFFLEGFAQVQLNGKVIDGNNQQTIANVIIYIDDLAPYFTLEDGSFFIQNLSKGKHELRLVKENYPEMHWQIDLQNDSSLSLYLFSKESYLVENLLLTKTYSIREVQVSTLRAKAETPTTFSNINREQLEQENLAQDLPYLLENEQSVVVFSDAGNGVGYTSMRIRGTDMSRINFTVNGVPFNDPESQSVFLVDVPDLASSINDIQIQRGVGTSTNGAAAFGGSVNIQTNALKKEAYAKLSNSFGSFATMKNTLELGSGLLKDKFTFDGRFSHLRSNGYIDRAFSKLWSYYFSAAYFSKSTIVRFNHFSGSERTYQAWNGVDKTTLESNRTFNSAGTDYGSTTQPYDNEIDKYKQDHYQLFINQRISNALTFNVGLFYIRGKGYFEQFKVASNFANYSLPNVVVGSDTIVSTDLVRRRWLDNHFYGVTYALEYKKNNQFDFTIGGAWNQYDGNHFGEIIWARFASSSNIRHRYYENNGMKTDFNIFAKINYSFSDKFLAFFDLQYRNVAYNVSGIDNDLRYIFHDVDYQFFNPKVGLNFKVNKNSSSYISFALANREPTRTDFIDSDQEPKHESLYNVELGYKFQKSTLSFNANYYFMYYNNQLVLNGSLNDVGSALRVNVDQSYRTGIEASASVQVFKFLTLKSNATWSINKIQSFEDENERVYKNAPIAYSPNWIGMAQVDIEPIDDFTISLRNKMVGKQFLDNTGNEAFSLSRYYQSDLLISYVFHTPSIKNIELSFLLNNFTNRKIVSNGYVYYGEAYYFPQAGINFLTGLKLHF